MALGGQMHHVGRPEGGEQRVHRGAVRDVGAFEAVVGQVRDGAQGLEVARVGELVEVEHFDARFARQKPHDRRSDEARTPGDQNPGQWLFPAT